MRTVWCETEIILLPKKKKKKKILDKTKFLHTYPWWSVSVLFIIYFHSSSLLLTPKHASNWLPVTQPSFPVFVVHGSPCLSLSPRLKFRDHMIFKKKCFYRSVGLLPSWSLRKFILTCIIMIPPFCLLWIFITCSYIKWIIRRPSLLFAARQHANNAKTNRLDWKGWWPVLR